jgi:hypothetical protein
MPTPPDFTNGTALDASSLNKVGLWLVGSGTLSGTSIIATNCFSSDFTNYRIMTRVSTASGGEAYVKLRNSGGTNSANYDWGLYGVSNPGGANSYAANNNPYIPMGGYTSSVTTLDLFSPNEAIPTYFTAQHSLDIAGQYYFRNYGGRHTPSTVWTSLDFQSGSAMTGKYFIYGFRN